MTIAYQNGNYYLVVENDKYYAVTPEIRVVEVNPQSWLKFSPYAEPYNRKDEELEKKIKNALQEIKADV